VRESKTDLFKVRKSLSILPSLGCHPDPLCLCLCTLKVRYQKMGQQGQEEVSLNEGKSKGPRGGEGKALTVAEDIVTEQTVFALRYNLRISQLG